jgi:hypothetical protein
MQCPKRGRWEAAFKAVWDAAFNYGDLITMRGRIVSAASAVGFLLATGLAMTLAAPVYAQTVPDDPLHLCYASPANCTSFNGVTVLSPSSSQPNPGDTSGWGISVSPAKNQTGQLWIALLIPDNEVETVLPTLTGEFGGTSVGVGAFVDKGLFGNSAMLDTLFGQSISPPNPINAYTPATAAVDPGFSATLDGYEVYLTKIAGTGPGGLTTLIGSSGQTNSLDNQWSLTGGDFTINGQSGTDSGVATGAIVTAWLDTTVPGGTNEKFYSTAQSSALLLDAPLAAAVPESRTWVMMLAGFGLLGFAAMRKGKREARLAV